MFKKITTKQGDTGYTKTLYAEELPKSNLVFDCIGNIDEAAAAIGLADAMLDSISKALDQGLQLELGFLTIRSRISKEQVNLTNLMGEISSYPRNIEKHLQNPNFDKIKKTDLESLETTINKLEEKVNYKKGWSTPGTQGLSAAQFDLAARVCRRAERGIVALHQNLEVRDVVLQYVNRLSDFLWLCARTCEADTLVKNIKGYYGGNNFGLDFSGDLRLN